MLGYPPHLVDIYLEKFGGDPKRDLIFDPFCGTGTTPLESKKQGFRAIGIDANPMAVLSSAVKTNWEVSIPELEELSSKIVSEVKRRYDHLGLSDWSHLALFSNNSTDTDESLEDLLSKSVLKLIPTGFISKPPLEKVLIIRECVDKIQNQTARDFFRLAMAHTIVKMGNVGFGPEVYRTKKKSDAPVLSVFQERQTTMIRELSAIQQQVPNPPVTEIFLDDARELATVSDNKFDIVVTSPPYPNEKDYSRSTRLESVLLGFLTDKKDLQSVKRGLLRSNTRTVYKGDDDNKYVEKFDRISKISQEIEQRRVAMGKTSGFERLYHRVTKLYFGGMYKHLLRLFPLMRSGARLAYVVGDQMSYLRVHIQTGEILAELADDIGYKVDGIDLWRERLSTTTKKMLREEVVLFRKP
ncbi:site-specific DNA-methyltransferase [Acidobacteria bacterium AH-259-D05]|nr:site-specific DNA-methyltransferase [Acidobacteria bacterium AH-259-D05]